MKKNKNILLLALILISTLIIFFFYQYNLNHKNKPNIVIILTDDLGYSDIGIYGSEIHTPNIDNLANNGIRYTNFYNTGRCWPTRAALLSGHYPQKINRDVISDESIVASKKNPFGKRPNWAILLPQYLENFGYTNFFSGKWHIDGKPIDNGFHKAYRLIDHDRHFDPKNHTQHGIPLEEIKENENYYSTTEITNHAIRYINDNHFNNKSNPFFLYLAYTAPHFPLQANEEDIKIYNGSYNSGWDSIRESRFKKQKEMGMIIGDLSEVNRSLGPPYEHKDDLVMLGENEINLPISWNKLTPQQKEFQSKKMEIHAAMVHRIDLEIGKVIDTLSENNILENTMIIFISDNGASSEIMIRGNGHDPDAKAGSKNSFLSLGPGWSSVSNTPFRKHKTWVHEGGIATPLIISWKEKIKNTGTIKTERGHVIDIVPTILDLINENPIKIQKEQNFPSFDGVSLASSVLSAEGNINRYDTRSLWFHHDGHKAIIKNNYKLVLERGSDWELYNLENDRAETNDIASGNPIKLKKLIKEYENITEYLGNYAKE
tara:strand:- start:65 stop:1699 length:1635 start_codon:yes stop_codon:yes gene_type:complete